MKETLFLTKHPWLDLHFLKDAAGNVLASYVSENLDTARKFCEEHNYKLHEST